ncbi:GTP-binding protein [Plasmodium gonderi]|uniref:Translation factor GUF1 homolog, mitochondrial n=1 Tax=Plasmodium gonderi TaxID=77519 RepID=A0A1Y1JHE8_PLAGO|nr:GTP-binding protein [Plasmodium gonderi]GAW80182.1 GTP-binding protein [Plasmodium gonderi]
MTHTRVIKKALSIFILIVSVLKFKYVCKFYFGAKNGVYVTYKRTRAYEKKWDRKKVFFNIQKNRGKNCRRKNYTTLRNDITEGLSRRGSPLLYYYKYFPLLFLLYEWKREKRNINKCNSAFRKHINSLDFISPNNVDLPSEKWKKQMKDQRDTIDKDEYKGDCFSREENHSSSNNTEKYENNYQEIIRNFCILAHIDSGKSTLADRFLELTKTIKKTKMQDQFLDMMSLEREKGITIKLKAVRMNYKNYIFNLIDTPGHFDFYHEVKRSLCVCEGAILLIDGCKGIQSQTLNIFLELQKTDLKIIPVINKIDMNTCILDKIKNDLINKFHFKNEEILHISAKYGKGIENLFQKIVQDIPFPTIKSNAFFRAIIFDSFYDQYKGVILIIKVINGVLKKKTEIFFIQSEKTYIIQEVGYLTPEMKPTDIIKQGDIAYVSSNIRNCDEIQISETIVSKEIVKMNTQKRLVIDTDKLIADRMEHNNCKGSSSSSSSTLLNHQLSKNEVDLLGRSSSMYIFRNYTDKDNIFEKHHKEHSNTEEIDQKKNHNVKSINKKKMERISNQMEKNNNLSEGGNEMHLKNMAVTKVDVSYPVVFCNIYSVNDKQSNELETALNKLKLNDASFSFKADICENLGKGFKCGFNGLLHLNIIQERIKREYNVETIVTAPSVNYLVKLNEKYIDKKLKEKLIDNNFDISNIIIDKQNSNNSVEHMNNHQNGDMKTTVKNNGLYYMTSNVNDIPQKNYILGIYEPYVKTNITTPAEFQKYIMAECFKRRGIFIKKDIMNDHIFFFFEMPLSEILINFLDEIKSCTKGYGSMSYENYVIYKESDLFKINIYINNKSIDSLAFIAHKLNYYEKCKKIVLKLKELIKPHQFLIVIQAGIGSKIFVSEKIKPLKKNVTAKCYGGDITRRKKLIEKQNAGKKKMFSIGRVNLPPNIFTKLFDLKAQ